MVTAAELGRSGYDKIAIIGSAPSSVRLGPWNDPTWAVWGCSPGAYGEIPFGRTDVYFELHRWEPPTPGDPRDAANRSWFSPEYVRFLELHEGPVFMSEPVASVKNCKIYPFADMAADFGPYFWTSSMAYMLALAIKLKPRAIGMWGVDMAAHSEYAFQRPGCQHFLGLAAAAGIMVVLPPESDLMQPPTAYGVSEKHPRKAKLLMRRNELQNQVNHHRNMAAQASAQERFFAGAVDNLDYILSTWVDDLDPGIEFSGAVSHAAMLAGRPVPLVAASNRFEETEIPEPLKLDPPLGYPMPMAAIAKEAIANMEETVNRFKGSKPRARKRP